MFVIRERLYVHPVVILVIVDHSLIFRVVIPDVVLIQLFSWGWAHSCSKHVDDSNKHNIEETVRRVGYSPEFTAIFEGL